MKKIYLTCTIALTALAGFAQTRNVAAMQQVNNNASAIHSISPEVLTNGCDTVWNILPTDTAVIYSTGASPNWGYSNGHNNFGDVSKAEKIHAASYTAGYKVVAAFMFFDIAADGVTPTIMQATIWGDNAGVPGTSLGTTPLPIAAMQTGGNPTAVSFATPVSVTGDFYVGLDGFVYQTPNQEDTVAIYSTTLHTQQATCNAFDQFSGGGGWFAWDSPSNWGNKGGFYMGAILCDPTLGNIEITNPGAEVIVFPNPSTGNVFVNFGKATSGNVSVKVYDAVGKVVSESNQNVQTNSTYKIELNGAAAGVYYMNISSANKTETKKIVIQ